MITAILLSCIPIVTDGDTFRCGRERIRLVGIDAPELPGHCRRGRQCVAGDPWASKRALAQALRARPLMIRRIALDRYGRTIAAVSAGGVDLSCHQLRAGAAAYVARWDDQAAVGTACHP